MRRLREGRVRISLLLLWLCHCTGSLHCLRALAGFPPNLSLLGLHTTYTQLAFPNSTRFLGRWISRILHHFLEWPPPPSLNIDLVTLGLGHFFCWGMAGPILSAGVKGNISSSLGRWCRIVLFHCLQVLRKAIDKTNIIHLKKLYV